MFFKGPFLRGLFLQGLIFGRAYKRRDVCVSNTWREICVSKSIELAYSWKEIYVSNLQKVCTETRLEDVDLSKTWAYKYFVHMDRGNQDQEWRRTTQTAIKCDTFWLQTLGTHEIVLWQIQKFIMLLYRFCFVLFCIWGHFPSTSPQGLIFGGAI